MSHLDPLPWTPNCVSTEATSRWRRLDPLPYPEGGGREDAIARVKAVVATFPRTELVEERGDYLHYVFSSKKMGFKDDVEFAFDDAARVVHFRSAAREGIWDLGVNRRRMKAVRRGYLAD
ncbi:MAG: DUF1499 domain-containing protein [Sumerlaeia bacterium]